MGRAEGGFADGEGAFEEGMGGGVVALDLQQARQAVEVGGNFRMGGAVGSFVDGKGTL
jgi:hypothetical protein